MKKIYLLTFSLFALCQMKAQTSYTLTQANSEPIVGDSYGSVSLDTNGVNLPINISGANVTWSVTGVTAVTTIINTYSTAASNPNSTNYSGTNLVQTNGNITNFYKSSTNMFELLGVESASFDLNYNAGNATIATYPMTFGYTNTDNTVGGDVNAVTPLGTLSGTFAGVVNTTVDGSGTLNINGVSSFPNCIRAKTTQNINFEVTSPFGPIAGTMDQNIYNFYHSSSKFPLFTISYSNIVTGSFPDQYQAQVSTLSTVVIGVKENKLNDVIFKTYPNPANNEVSLHFVLVQPESYIVEISNTLGQVVKTVSMLNLQPGMYNETINTTDLSAGIYTIKVSGKNSQGTEKLIIQK